MQRHTGHAFRRHRVPQWRLYAWTLCLQQPLTVCRPGSALAELEARVDAHPVFVLFTTVAAGGCEVQLVTGLIRSLPPTAPPLLLINPFPVHDMGASL